MAGFGEDSEEKTEEVEEVEDSQTEGNAFSKLKQMSKSVGEDGQKNYINVGIYGKPKTGKTHLGMSAPGPVYFIDTESGTNPLEGKFKNREIYINSINVSEEDYSKDHVKSWEKFVEAVNTAVEAEDELDTVVVDSTTDIWSYVQNYCKVEIWGLAPEERLNQQWDWGDINQRYTNLIQKLMKADFNLILTAKAREEYGGAGDPTGNFEPKWQNKTSHWLDLVVYNEKDIQDDGSTRTKSTVEASRYDLSGTDTIMGRQIEMMEWDDLEEVVQEARDGGSD